MRGYAMESLRERTRPRRGQLSSGVFCVSLTAGREGGEAITKVQIARSERCIMLKLVFPQRET